MSTSPLPTRNGESYTTNEYRIIKHVYKFLREDNFKHPYKKSYEQGTSYKVTGCCQIIAWECIRGQGPDKKKRGRPLKEINTEYEKALSAIVTTLHKDNKPASSVQIEKRLKLADNGKHTSSIRTVQRDLPQYIYTYGRHHTKNINHDSPAVVAS
ncbi:hypothetical protein BDA99DRAFT_556092 [Phascolomyces articulosus]|uniref:Uncharacterized protein n=1 Tax=Phascolomyces articulosus TaxID=60185 RepID=A0AAD5PIQ6_9FUNG|nr:hypothetical protein BDA99DRAFT_556092 [Phascolomyces articulosus]